MRIPLPISDKVLANFFNSKKVVVTGGSSGIGKALAYQLLAYGANISIVSERMDALQSTLGEFAAAGFSAHSFYCDLSRGEDIDILVNKIVAEVGAPDILINNAGFAVYRTFEQSSIDEIDRLIAVNFLAALRLTHHLLPYFIQRRSGAIVNMASIAGTMALTPNATYCAAKHALVGWSECLSYELAPFNIHVNIICPGRVLTSFFDHETFRTRAARRETSYTVPLPRVVDKTLRAIVNNRPVSFIPLTLGFITYLIAAMPLIFKPAYRILMRSRIDSIYGQR